MPLIVILDDQPTNRAIFSKLASSIDPEVTVRAFGDPVVALEWVRDNIPDLVVTDFKMPHMDGAEFIRRFREQSSAAEVPVVVITISEERSFRLRALEAGATDFLQSPVDHHEFVTRARNLLKLRKQQLLLERKLEHSERSRVEALRESSERLAQVIDTVPAMITATDHDGHSIFVNAYQTAILGPDLTLVNDDSPESRSLSDRELQARALDRKVFETNAPLLSFEEEIADRTGTKRVFLTTKSPLRDNSNAVSAVLTTSIDITTRKRAEAHLLHMAHHDALTDLPNRTLLRTRLNRAIARARRGDGSFALHVIDLDGFKTINDVLGHSVGDKFLKTVGQRLSSVVGDPDTVARLGGDEFAIVQTGLSQSEDVVTLAKRINEVVAQPHMINGEKFTSTASIGITLHPSDGSDADQLLQNADLAMYRAKADGGNSYCFYDADMNERVRSEVALDNAMREAISNKEFLLYYQPQVDVKEERVVGAEALLRWRQPDGTIAGPAKFLARIEENGLIVPINEWVLREACREAKTWQREGEPPMRISVNLSPIQFRKLSVPLLVTRVLAETGLDPRCLDLELTESIMMQDAEIVANDLRQLRELGVSISIDDFGTGFSSLTYIKQFPVDRLKIDQCFVRNLPADPNDAAIVRAIVSLGHSLELDVVAEGVETPEQLKHLRSEGCNEMQGYYFAKPMPADEFVAFFRGQHHLARTA